MLVGGSCGTRFYYSRISRGDSASFHADTVVVLTINYADWGSDGVIILTRSAPYEKSKSLGSGGSMVARLKLKDIDGRAPPGVNYLPRALRLRAVPALWPAGDNVSQ